MIKVCIFDLDGTVLDTLSSIAHFGNAALVRNGLAPIDEREYRYFAGNGIHELIHRMLCFHGVDTNDMYERVYRDYRSAYHSDVTYGTRMFEGLPQILKRLHDDGIKLAIVSNKPDVAARGVVRSLFGDGFFTHVIGQIEGVPLKPNPAAVRRVLDELQLPRESACYVGDTSTDMITARNAGVHAIGVLWGFRDEEELRASGADVLCATPQALYQAIHNIGKDEVNSVC